MTMASAASNPELMALEPQDISAEVDDASIAAPSKGKKRRRAFSGNVRSTFLFL